MSGIIGGLLGLLGGGFGGLLNGNLASVSGESEEELVLTASVHDSVPVVGHPAVGDEDGVNEGPDTGSSESDGLEGSEEDETEESEDEEGSETGSESDGENVARSAPLVGSASRRSCHKAIGNYAWLQGSETP